MKNIKYFRFLFNSIATNFRSYASYVQGQSPDPKIREYFYYIDHNGQLFLDDARMKNFTSCFKDKDFLVFFYSRLRKNEFQRYANEFPFVSLCGRERNFVRCDDTPIVFTQILKKNGDERLSYNNGGERLTVQFEPERIFMNPESGRVYYPMDEKFDGFGLVKSTINEELSPFFVYDNGDSAPPTKLKWNKIEHKLTNELFEILKNRPDRKILKKSA